MLKSGRVIDATAEVLVEVPKGDEKGVDDPKAAGDLAKEPNPRDELKPDPKTGPELPDPKAGPDFSFSPEAVVPDNSFFSDALPPPRGEVAPKIGTFEPDPEPDGEPKVGALSEPKADCEVGC